MGVPEWRGGLDARVLAAPAPPRWRRRRGPPGAPALGSWMRYSEVIGRGKSEKLDLYLKLLYGLLRDVLLLREGRAGIRNQDLEPQLASLARKVSFAWIRKAVKNIDELNDLIRRNI